MKFLFLLLIAGEAFAGRVLTVPDPKPTAAADEGLPDVDIAFYNRGELVGKYSVKELAPRVVPQWITVLDPYALADEVYRGFPLESLFYVVYKEKWRRADN